LGGKNAIPQKIYLESANEHPLRNVILYIFINQQRERVEGL